MSKYVKYTMVVFGSGFMSLGIYLMALSGLGMAPVAVVITGLADVMSTTYGVSNYWIMGVTITALFFVDRKRLGYGTVINVFCTGLFTDILFHWNPVDLSGEFASWILMIVSIVAIGMGIGIYVSAELGEGAVEAVMVVIHDRSGYAIKWVKIAMDCLLALIGIILGQRIGIGTVISMIATGPIIGSTLKAIQLFHRYRVVVSD